MSDLIDAIQDLDDALNQGATFEECVQKIQHLFEEGAGASLAERNEALPHLARLIEEIENDLLAGYVAIAAGALVEQRADPLIAAEAILNRLEIVTDGAHEYFEACIKAGAFAQDADTEAIMKTVAEGMPRQAFQWNVLERVYVAPIALLARSKSLRKQTQKERLHLQELIEHMSDHNVGAGWLNKMLAVLDDGELLVLHPEQGKGYRLMMEGIASNFDLHTLLAAALIGDPAEGWLEGKAPDPDVVEALQGEYSPDHPTHTQGAFNLVNYTGLKADGTVGEDVEGRQHWIWNEGIPYDIKPFEGLRVILLTRPPYSRSWSVERTFGGMVGRLYIQQTLTSGEVKAWLLRLRES